MLSPLECASVLVIPRLEKVCYKLFVFIIHRGIIINIKLKYYGIKLC